MRKNKTVTVTYELAPGNFDTIYANDIVVADKWTHVNKLNKAQKVLEEWKIRSERIVSVKIVYLSEEE